MWVTTRVLLQEIKGARNSNVQASAAIWAVCCWDLQRFSPSSCSSHRFLAFTRARSSWNSCLSSSKWCKFCTSFMMIFCVAWDSLARRTHAWICSTYAMYQTTFSFSEPNHLLAILQAYRNFHQAKSMMLDSGKKRRGGTSCRPYVAPYIFGFHNYFVGVYCDADIQSSSFLFLQAKKCRAWWTRSWIC